MRKLHKKPNNPSSRTNQLVRISCHKNSKDSQRVLSSNKNRPFVVEHARNDIRNADKRTSKTN